jgi:hypothetical protein
MEQTHLVEPEAMAGMVLRHLFRGHLLIILEAVGAVRHRPLEQAAWAAAQMVEITRHHR